MIDADSLEERDSTQVLSIYGSDKKEIPKQKWRDLIKSAIIKASDYGILVLLGVENQSDVHYAMQVRNMIYDAMTYGNQVNENAKKHRIKKEFETSTEFLSGLKKSDKLTPVITLTVYWGADKWDAPRSLYDMFDERYKSILPFVENYNLHLIVPEEINNFEQFRTSLGEVLEFIKASKDENQMDNVVRNNPAFRKLENEAVSAINVFTGIKLPINRKEGVTDMCKAWEDHRQAGIKEGLNQGEAIKLIELVCKKIQKGKTVEEIAESLEETEETIERIYKVALGFNARVEERENIYKELNK